MFGSAWCSGMGVGGWVAMVAFWVAFLGVVVWAVGRVFPDRAAPAAADPVALLDQRFASGEVDAEDYRRLRAFLTDDEELTQR